MVKHKRTLFLAQERTGSTFFCSLIIGQPLSHNGRGNLPEVTWLNTSPPQLCRHYQFSEKAHMIEDLIKKRPTIGCDESYFWTPPAIFHPEWFESFPAADWKFVYLFRDPRNRLESLSRRISRNLGPDKHAEIRRKILENYAYASQAEMDSIRRMLPDSRFSMVLFKDLIAAPIDMMTHLFDWIGYEIPTEQYIQVAETFQKEYLNSSFDDRGLSVHSRWHSWSVEDCDFFKGVAGQGLIDFGFESDLSWQPPPPSPVLETPPILLENRKAGRRGRQKRS